MRRLPSKYVFGSALSLMVVVAFFVRCLPLLLPNGAQKPARFDEGVYLSAARLFFEGQMPYQDFVVLHPPGHLLLLWPLTSLADDLGGWTEVLLVVRWLSALVGVGNVLLLVSVVSRWRGRHAGLVAGALYAAYRPAIEVEGQVMLEPFVVLLVLLGAHAWLPRSPGVTPRRAMTAGALIAGAGLVKLTGGLAMVALLLSPPGRGQRFRGLWSIAGATMISAVVLVPFAVAVGPSRVWDQVVLAQAARPGGDLEGGSIPDVQHRLLAAGRFGVFGADVIPDTVVWLLLLLVALAAFWALVRGGREGRFWATSLVVLLGAPLFAPDYYDQYSVPAAVPMSALLAALSADAIARLSRVSWVAGSALTIGVSTVLIAGLADVTRDAWLLKPTTSVDFGAKVQAVVGERDCIFSDPPGLALAADRLPPRDRSGSFLIDPFGALLVESLHQHVPGTTPDVLKAPPAQARLKTALSACPYVALNALPSRNGRMSAETAEWFERRFRPVPSASTSYGVLWQVRDRG
jgi:hypothetical protein